MTVHVALMDHKADRKPPEGTSFSQMRPKAGEGSPEWYAPNRDLLHKFPSWLVAALQRFEDVGNNSTEQDEFLKAFSKELGGTVNKVCQGDFAGKSEDLRNTIRELGNKYPAMYGAVGSALLTEMLWRFWEFAGDVSLRQEGPIKQ